MRRYLAVLAIALTMALPVAAQQGNLSGTWKLNLATSFMGGDHPAPDYELTKVLSQEGQTIRQTDVAKHVSIVNIPQFKARSAYLNPTFSAGTPLKKPPQSRMRP